jgi:hypothetical protein
MQIPEWLLLWMLGSFWLGGRGSWLLLALSNKFADKTLFTWDSAWP